MKTNRRFFPRKRTLFLVVTLFITAFVGFAYGPVRKALDSDPLLALGDKKLQRIIDGKGHLYLNWPEYGALGSTDPNSLPTHIVNAVLAREDKRFFKHPGVDPVAFGRIVLANLKGKRHGGSTVTMQLVDITYEYPERSRIGKIRSKIFEIVMAFRVESAARNLTGDRKNGKLLILASYLDRIPYSGNLTGIQQAAHSHFAKDLDELNLGESAYLVGLIRAPIKNSVYRSESNAIAAKNAVVDNMEKLGLITPKEADEARFYAKPKAVPKKRRGDGYTSDAIRSEIRSHQNAGKLPEGLLKEASLEIVTTFDPVLQDYCMSSLERQIRRIESSVGTPNQQSKRINGCVVVLRNSDSAILAMVGGRSFDMLQLNLATSQPGRPVASAIKPISYAALLEAEPRLSITSRISNIPPSGKLINGYFGNFAPRECLAPGSYPLWVGLKESSNRMGINAGLQAGHYHWNRLLMDLGITTQKLAHRVDNFIGAFDVRPVDLAAAYACLARGGEVAAPYLVQAVHVGGNEIYRHQSHPRKVMDPRTCSETTKALREVIATGTASRQGGKELARKLPVAGKSGTSDGGADAWFCGYSSHVTVVVWMGYPHASKGIFRNASGSNTAFPVWKEIITEMARRGFRFAPLPSLQDSERLRQPPLITETR
jgi:membrane peptidoglycan carboxypeptidase